MPRRVALLLPLLSLACSQPRSSSDDAESTSGTHTSTSGSDTSTSGTDTSGGTETETGGDTDPGVLECPEVGAPQARATVTSPEIDEASGLVRSRTQELFWVHNDSGDSARLFALGLDGSVVAELQLAGAAALDWEDLALGPGPGPGDYLYAGDIGDNAEARPNITIYRVPEPADVAQIGADPIVSSNWDALVLTYPDGPHNAETLLVDPVSGDLLIVTKGEQTRLYRLAAPLAAGELELLDDPNFPSAIATGGDISPLGDLIMVRAYADAFAWLRAPGQSVAEAMLGEPCPIPLAVEQQGETLAIDADGSGYWTLSEGSDQPLWRFEL